MPSWITRCNAATVALALTPALALALALTLTLASAPAVASAPALAATPAGAATPALGPQHPSGVPAEDWFAPPLRPLRVLRPFTAPVHSYAAGHRGVDLRARAGQPVRSTGPGTVGFAGDVAGRGVVTIVHGPDVETTYQPIHPSVRTGQRVNRGEVIGRVATASGPDCAGVTCLHWGLRFAGTYLDPVLLLRPSIVLVEPARPGGIGR
ncbi:MAG: M23 family metallopeptidase [Actinomycetales bacterium]|nr:M23 family metallopeptidase [Actinomycetales bacterium]